MERKLLRKCSLRNGTRLSTVIAGILLEEPEEKQGNPAGQGNRNPGVCAPRDSLLAECGAAARCANEQGNALPVSL